MHTSVLMDWGDEERELDIERGYGELWGRPAFRSH